MISFLVWAVLALAHAAVPATFRVEATALAQEEVRTTLLDALGHLQVPPEQVEFVDPQAPTSNDRRRYWANQLDDARYVVGAELNPEHVQAIDSAARQLRNLDRRDAPRSPANHLLAIDVDQARSSVRISYWRAGQHRKEAISRTLPRDAASEMVLDALVRLIPELDRPPRASLIVSQEAEGYPSRIHVEGGSGTSLAITPGLPVLFNAGGSYDPEQGLQGMEYRWSVDQRIVATTLEPTLSWTFEEPFAPSEHVVEVLAIASGQESLSARVTLSVSPRVLLRDRTKTLWVLGTSSFADQTKVRLWVEPVGGAVALGCRWRQIEGPALTCASIDTTGVKSCEDLDRLTVFTYGGTLDLRPQRGGTYVFEVVQHADGVPSRPVRASTTAAYTRSSLRGPFSGHLGVSSYWSQGSSQVGVALEAAPPWLLGLRGRLGPVFAVDVTEQAPTAIGVQAGFALDLLEVVSATLDDPARPKSPRLRSSMASDPMFDWHLEGVYQFQDPTALATTIWPDDEVRAKKLPYRHSILLVTGPVLQRRGRFLRVNATVRKGLGEGESGQLGLATEVGIRGLVAAPPRGESKRAVYDAYERLHERRTEGRACVDVLPADVGPNTVVLALSQEFGGIVRCETTGTWAAYSDSRRAQRAGGHQVPLWWGPIDQESEESTSRESGTRVAILVPKTTGEEMVARLQASVLGGSLKVPVLAGIRWGEARVGEPPGIVDLGELIELDSDGEEALAGFSPGPSLGMKLTYPHGSDTLQSTKTVSVSVSVRSFTRDLGSTDTVGLLILDLKAEDGDGLALRQARWSIQPLRLMDTVLPLVRKADSDPAQATESEAKDRRLRSRDRTRQN
jgi:hypothetical protein